MKINLEKCIFVKPEVKVLGHLVSKQGIHPDPKKVEIKQQLTPPKDVTGAKSFMGVIKYFCKFITCCSIMANPLLKLMCGRKNSKVKFNWGEDQQLSFEALIAHLMKAPILRFLNFNMKFCIKTDASTVGLDAMLSQAQGDDGLSDRLPVVYTS